MAAAAKPCKAGQFVNILRELDVDTASSSPHAKICAYPLIKLRRMMYL